MKDLEKITMEDENGEKKEAEVVTIVDNENLNKKYVIYTFDSNAENVDLYASEMIEKEDEIIFDSIKTEEEWKFIQTKISELASE